MDFAKRLESADCALKAAISAKDKALRALETYSLNRLRYEYSALESENEQLRKELEVSQTRKNKRSSSLYPIKSDCEDSKPTNLDALSDRIGALHNVFLSQKTMLQQCCEEVTYSREETQELTDAIAELNRQIATMASERLCVQEKRMFPVDKPFFDDALTDLDVSFGPEPEESVPVPKGRFVLVSKPQVAAQLITMDQNLEQIKVPPTDDSRLIDSVVMSESSQPSQKQSKATPRHSSSLRKSLRCRSPWTLA